MSDRQVSIRPTSTLAAPAVTDAYSVEQVLGQVALIQHIMAAAMKDGEHYGKIPGCGNKPTLLKAGAEKLCLTFRLAPTYDVDERQLDRDHREYRVTTTLTSITTQAFIGQGVGTCTTMEGKYRYRGVTAEATDKPVPRNYWDLKGEDPAKAQELIGGKGFSVKKVDGKGWMIAKGGEKAENDNPADHYNTVLKMAKKRALVDAVLTATAASDLFTQDLEDITANLAIAQAHRPALAAAGEGQGGSGPGKAVPTSTSSVDSGANAPRGGSPTPVAVDDNPPWETVPPDAPAEPIDFRETRIHFGKNRGLTLGELSPQQVHWYEHDWMPKKEVNGPTTVEDLALMNALKAYSTWRGVDRPNEPAKPAKASKPAPKAEPTPTPENESQEPVVKAEDVSQAITAPEICLRAVMAKDLQDPIKDGEMDSYLRTVKRDGKLILPSAMHWYALDESDLAYVMQGWKEKHRHAILALRKADAAAKLLPADKR